ncbi:MAG: ACP S-malonyltransferase, partial [Myxococcales bacterium]
MKTAWLFPGQGMEEPRMGLAFAAVHPEARRLLAWAGDCIRQDALKLLESHPAKLGKTDILQPVLTAVALGACLACRDALPSPDFTAGHSLGEVAALSASGLASAADAVRLAAARGAIMAREAGKCDGGMAALFGGREDVERALAAAERQGAVDLAAHNAPEEWVLSGERRALARLAAAFPLRRLGVSGP